MTNRNLALEIEIDDLRIKIGNFHARGEDAPANLVNLLHRRLDAYRR